MIAASLPGLAALLALLFAWMQVSQTNKQLAISERGQITSRFNSAVTNLGSASLDIRLGGVMALEQIMHDSPGYQPTITSLITAYIREHASTSRADLKRIRPTAGDAPLPPSDIFTSVLVLEGRNPKRDRYRLDLEQVELRGMQFPPTKNFQDALFSKSDLSSSLIEGLDLHGTEFDESNLSGAQVWETNLSGSDLQAAHAVGTDFCNGVTTGEGYKSGGEKCATKFSDVLFSDADLREADLVGADLSSATLCLERDEVFTEPQCPNLAGAYLNAANLKGVNLSEANLRGADLSDADLTGADLSKADLSAANLTGAKTIGTDFHDANVTGVKGLPTAQR
ncbi:pentapeptide repeat-containing protein [Streptomyces hayashii]|uniref:pentapeptide repeat-containing protein n=1 Tax=Streptomyces hayashii TaxID=2839966 RepID=UPI00403C1C7B